MQTIMLPEQYVATCSQPAICLSKDNTILALNDVACSLLDAEPDYFLRKSLHKIFHDIQTDTEFSLSRENYTRVWFNHPSGQRFVISLRLDPTEDTSDEISLLYLKDIDKQLEGHKLAQRYLEVFENIEEAVFLAPIDDTGVHQNFIDVNKAARQRLNYNKQEMLEMNARSLNPALNLERVRAFGHRILQEKLIKVEAIHVTSDGTHIPVEVTAKLIERQGKKYVLSFARDLRKNKKP
ncbi:MAG: PAS domain-containing protein [Gammaproteobacteria bacterium]|nr:PAS domain-containing protein [Gammaproteobacteria bacterium]